MTAETLRALEEIVAPADALRRSAFALLGRKRILTRIVSQPDVRVPLLASAHIALLFALTLARPLWLFYVGPVVLGVPHLASDVRYLLLRQGVSRVVAFIAGGASAILLAVRGLAPLSEQDCSKGQLVMAAAWVGSSLIAGAREARSLRPLVALPPIIGLTAAAFRHAPDATLILAHAHNVIGIGAWLIFFRRGRTNRYVPLVVGLALASALLFTPAAARCVSQLGGAAGFGVGLIDLGATLVPGTPAKWAAAAALSFVFLQAVHYAAWLGWIPQGQLPGRGTFTFRMTARALLRDFGTRPLALVCLISLAIAVAALFDVKRAASTYMNLASFHGFFEIAMIAYLLARRAGPAPP